MEKVPAGPESVRAAVRASLDLTARILAAVGRLPEDPDAEAALRNLTEALWEQRAVLEALEPTAALLDACYEAGRADERAASERARRPLRAAG